MTFTGIESHVIFIKPSRKFIKLSAQDIFDFFQVKTKNIQFFYQRNYLNMNLSQAGKDH